MPRAIDSCLLTAVVLALYHPLPAMAEAAERSDQVHVSYRYDRANDRTIYGGYSHSALVGGDASLTAPGARVIYARSMSDDAVPSVLFQLSEGHVAGFEVSATGRLAVLAVDSDLRPGESSSHLANRMTLRILDRDGKPLTKPIAQVRDFVWDASGSALAYCTGEADDEIDDFRMNGTWLLDLSSGDTRRILDTGRHVAWGPHDGNLYVREIPTSAAGDARTWQFDPRSDTLSEVDFKGINFSPTGAFYFERKSPNWGRFGLFESKTGRSLLDTGADLSALYPEPVRWFANSDVLVLQSWFYRRDGKAQPTPHTLLYDARTDRVIDIGEKAILGFDGSDRVVHWRPGGFDRLDPQQLLRTAPPGPQ